MAAIYHTMAVHALAGPFLGELYRPNGAGSNPCVRRQVA